MIYWTKYKKGTVETTDDEGNIVVTEIEGSIDTSQTEPIYEEFSDFVPDTNGFKVNMNGISYYEYTSNPNEYAIMAGILYKKTDLDAYR